MTIRMMTLLLGKKALLLVLLLLMTMIETSDSATDETVATSTTNKPARQHHHRNMNAAGGEYKIANSNSYPTDYHQDEYFEVYSPVIKTRYSAVYWRFQEPLSLPDIIKDRFAHNGKVMAVTGYEVDQVRIITNENGTKEEVPVPITWAYNHHYIVYLSNSKKSKLVKRKVDQKNRAAAAAAHPHLHHDDELGDYYWAGQRIHDDNLKEDSSSNVLNDSGDDDKSTIIPLLQAFSEGNGGEFRMSYHGYPKGYAQLIESPDTFISNPMHIDTWNRTSTSAAFEPGPLPRSSRIPAEISGFSGLIECPCSNRLPKKWSMSYATTTQQHDDGDDHESVCSKGEIQNATECFLGARTVVQAQKHVDRTVSDPHKPLGCSVEQHINGSVDILWNAYNTSSPSVGSHAAESTTKLQESSSPPTLIAFSHAQINATVVLKQDEEATITIVGPADKWFGLAFGSSSMCIHTLYSDECPEGGPYAIIVSGETVTERKLGFHGAGEILETSVTIVSNSVSSSGNRTVVVTRSLQALTPKHYEFDLSIRSIPIIMARGCSLEFARHCGHGPSMLNFLAVETPTRVCKNGIKGTIDGNWFDNNRCGEPPKSDVKVQGNAACSVQTYRGGMTCCRDGQSLLDQEQNIPWPDQYLEFRLKFRFYFQDYHQAVSKSDGDLVPASHQNLIRLFMQTEYRSGEYDIEPCPKGTPSKYCVHSITSRWKVSEMMVDCSIREDASWCTGSGSSDPDKIEGIKLIYVGPHCHAPSCLSMELYNADTGQLLCHSEPIQGQSSNLYDEKGFLAIPPCLYGSQVDGLPPPVLLTMNTTLLLIKKNNNTHPHTGEMAYWQMRGVVVPKKLGTTSNAGLSPSLIELAEPHIQAVDRGQLRYGDDGD